jgi:uncharacterized membrane protein YhaH (DUF805 family)
VWTFCATATMTVEMTNPAWRVPVLAGSATVTATVVAIGVREPADLLVLVLGLAFLLGVVARRWRAVLYAALVPFAFMLPLYAAAGRPREEAEGWLLFVIAACYVAVVIALGVRCGSWRG